MLDVEGLFAWGQIAGLFFKLPFVPRTRNRLLWQPISPFAKRRVQEELALRPKLT